MPVTNSHCRDPEDPASKQHELPLFRRGQWYSSCDRSLVHDSPGATVLGLAPEILLRDDVRWFRRHGARSPRPSRIEGQRILHRALERFGNGEVVIGSNREHVSEFLAVLSREVGLPPQLSRRWLNVLSLRLASLGREVPAASLDGGLGLVSLPANTFLCLETAMRMAQACDAVWLRPSRREPFSAARWVAALIAEGWPPDRVAFYPSTRRSLLTLLDYVDRAVLYGGRDLERVVGTRSSGQHVVVEGPGLARALIGADVSPAEAVEWLMPLIAADAGRLCTNVGTILSLGSVDELGERLAVRLDRISIQSPPGSPWQLATCVDPATAASTAAWILGRVGTGDRFLTKRGLVQHVDGRTVLAPGLVALAQPDGHPLMGVELPFPFAVLIASSPQQGVHQIEGARFVHTLGSDARTVAREAADLAPALNTLRGSLSV